MQSPPKHKTRLCLATGTWQLLMLSAALNQADKNREDACDVPTHLLLHQVVDTNRELEDWMLRLAPAVFGWSGIHWARDDWRLVPPVDMWPIPLAEEKEKLKHLTGLERVDELWVCHFHCYAERLAAETFPDARVVLFEEGLDPYCPMVVRSWRTFHFGGLLKSLPALLLSGKLRNHLASLRIYDWRVSDRYLRRIEKVYLFLTGVFPELKCEYRCPIGAVRRDALRAVIDRACRLDAVRDALGRTVSAQTNTVLLLSPFSVFDEYSREEAVSILKEALQRLLKKGYHVHVKMHPRVDASFWPDLHKSLGAAPVRECGMSQALPVEVLAGQARYCAYVSAASSALFYLQALYGAPVYSFTHLILSRPETKRRRGDWELVARLIPPLECMPDVKNDQGEEVIREDTDQITR